MLALYCRFDRSVVVILSFRLEHCLHFVISTEAKRNGEIYLSDFSAAFVSLTTLEMTQDFAPLKMTEYVFEPLCGSRPPKGAEAAEKEILTRIRGF